jgi:hypothetical protein
MRTAIAFSLVAACGFVPNHAPNGSGDGGQTQTDGQTLTQGSDAGSGSGSGSGSSGSGSGSICYGTYISVCPKVAPSAALTVSTFGKAYDTDVGSSDCIELDPANDAICVVAGTTVSFGNTVGAHGSRPLVVLSLDTLDVSATLDVGSHPGIALSVLDHQQGPDSDPTDCTGTGPTADGGGGYGGSFGSVGGTGNGTPGPIITPTTLRGGCLGGLGKAPNAFAQVGHGGGAVLLIAKTSISVLGAINASGLGGGGGGANQGGNGGGAGGMIVLDAPSVVVGTDTMIYANGGGGGGGGSTVAPGGTGSDPSGYKTGGGGGGGGFAPSSGTAGGDGGSGATNTNTAPGNGVAGAANGGGGGGFGVIKIFQATGVDTTRFSPPPT